MSEMDILIEQSVLDVYCQEIKQFRKSGVAIFRNVLSSDVIFEVENFLLQSLQQLKIDLVESFPKFHIAQGKVANYKEISEAINNILNDVQKSNLSKDQLNVLIGHFPLNVRLSKKLHCIANSEKLQILLKTLLETTKLFMHCPPTARYVLPNFDPSAVPAHQDISYNHHLGEFVTVWAPLVPINEKCGGVSFFDMECPKEELLTDFSAETWLKAVDVSKYRRIHAQPMEPGDVLIFNKWIVHQSMPNFSDYVRLSIDQRFFGDNSGSCKHYLDLQTGEIKINNG